MSSKPRFTFRSTACLFLSAAFLVLLMPSLSGAGKWKIPKQAKPLYYKMRSTTFDRKGKAKTVIYDLDIQATEEKDERGQPIFLVRSTQEHKVPARDIRGQQLAFGAMQLGLANVAAMQWVMYQALLGQLELAVGEKMSYFGGMLAKVTAKETIAGHEGFVVQILNTANDQEKLMAELVVNPDIPVALRARSYRKDKVQTENLLLKYTAR